MNTPTSESSAHRARTWLATHAIPTWLERGFDKRRGYFHEGLNSDLTPVEGPVRAMVQARQIYSFRVALDLELCPMETAARAVTDGARFLLDHARHDDGSYAFSLQPGLGIVRHTPELYTQAFVLFGLGNAFALAPMPEYRRRALELLNYLRTTRATAGGGFTELDADERVIHRSNPVMHLFEAALYWTEIDPNEPRWAELAHDLATFARARLIDAATGLIAEEYDADWAPHRENDRFYWEPGHQFEWAWLFAWHQRLGGAALAVETARLYELATQSGVRDGRVIDQVWSDFTHRARTARFWPQAERVKAAVRRGDGAAATEALDALHAYLDVPRLGLWCDTVDESGRRDERPSKASSLYHIVGAMAEYLGERTPAAPTRDRPAGPRGKS